MLKMKLWKKQQKGKARLQERADKTQIQIPASIFKELLKIKSLGLSFSNA